MDSKWSNIEVGNIIKINRNEIVPCDILVIKSSNENGYCYMQTTNLDGESNYKPIQSLKVTQNLIHEDNLHLMDEIFSPKNDNSKIEVSQPNNQIYEINGTLFLNKNDKHLFNIKNTLLRGSRLKNVENIYGIALYTGKDTKILQNINHSSIKLSYIEKTINKIIICILLFRIILTIIIMICQILFRNKYTPDYEKNELKYDYIFVYFGDKNYGFGNIQAFTFSFILTGSLVPISVIIMMQVMKGFLIVLIENFDKNYVEDKGDKIKCYSNSLLEECGMIKYIFSDKTGTLTKNELIFKACSIFTSLFDEIIYDCNFSNKFSLTNASTSLHSKFEKNFDKINLINRILLKDAPLEIKDMNGCDFNNQREAIEEFLLNICINHNCIQEKNKENSDEKEDDKEYIHNNKKNNNDDDDFYAYQGNNPDEITLVSIASELGYSFISCENDIITIEIKNLQTKKKIYKKFEILKKIDFNSYRQHSAIIVKNDLNLIKIYTKGSDLKIFKKLNKYSIKNVLKQTQEHLDSFAKRGLRTLCFSYKIIDNITYNKWANTFNKVEYECQTDKGKEKDLEKLIDEIEENQTLLGVTALEDKLQSNVKEDISSFLDAGIKVSMITGDKMETAECIGNSCGLISDDIEVFKIKEMKDEKEIIEKLKKIQKNIEKLKENLNNFNNFGSNKKNNNNINYINDKKDHNNINSDLVIEKLSSINIKINDCNSEKEDKIVNNSSKIKILNEKNDNDINKNENNIYKEKKQKRKESNISNSMILKYMVDNEQIKNDDIDYENLTIIKKNIRKPSISISNTKFYNFNNNITNKNNNNYIDNNSSIKNNFNENEIDLKDISIKENNKNINKSVNKKNSKKQINREITAIPTNSNKFLLYYNKCLKILNYINDLENHIPFIFKIPYIFGKVNNNNDNEKNLNKNKNNNNISIKIKYSLIIEGISILNCITNLEASKIIWELIKHSHSLICCRCSPLQKSKIIEFIKKNTQERTLAIGDGENDVNMIKTANIGIGIFGKEGYQAAYNSDYAISQFKYLKRLLFISGRFTIKRNSYFLYQFFFRNILYTIPLVIFIFYSGYGATFFYDDFYNMAKNSYMAILPIMFYVIFDEDINLNNLKEDKNLKYLLPDIYAQTRNSYPFNAIKFFVIFCFGIFLSFPIFYLNFYSLNNYQVYGLNGREFSILEPSLSIYLNSIIFHFYNIYLDTHHYNWPIYVSYFFQIIIDFIFIIVYEVMNTGNMLGGNVFEIFSSLTFLLVLVLTSYVLCLPYYILNRMKYFFGGSIVNLYKITIYNKKNKKNIYKNDDKGDLCLQLYLKKYYIKKLEQMSMATKSINKFKMIYKDIKDNINYENNDINYDSGLKDNNNDEEYNLNEIKLVNNVKKFIKFKKKLIK